MTITGQNFTTHQGDTEDVIVVLDLSESPGVDIETCDFHWAVYKPTTKEIVMQKSTSDGIVADNSDNTITISIIRDETLDLYGHYLHICKMVDASNNEYTPFSGTLDIYESVI